MRRYLIPVTKRLLCRALLLLCLPARLAFAVNDTDCTVKSVTALQDLYEQRGYFAADCVETDGRFLVVVSGTIALKWPVGSFKPWPIHLKGINQGKLDASDWIADPGCLLNISDNGNLIEDLTIDNGYGSGVCISGTNNELRHVTIDGGYGSGLLLSKEGNTITNSTIHGSHDAITYGDGVSCVDASTTFKADDGPPANACKAAAASTDCPDGLVWSDFLGKCTAATPGGGSTGGSTGGTTAGATDDPTAPSPIFCSAAALLAGASKCCKDPLATYDAKSNTCVAAAANIVDIDQDGVPDSIDHCVGVNDPTNVCATGGTTGGSTGGTTGGTTGGGTATADPISNPAVACGTAKSGASGTAGGAGISTNATGCNATTPTPNTSGLSPTIASTGGGSCALILNQRAVPAQWIRLAASCLLLVGMLFWRRRRGAALTTR